ncbi:MAG: NAD-dependent epimerase/dehydratase family protein [Patescibacteria group bacterium]
MQSVLITGSNGFIGQHIAAKLKLQNIRVIEFCRQNNQDLINPQDFNNLPKVDTVFHLAAVSGYKNAKASLDTTYKVNVLGTINALEYCRRVKAKIILSSTYVYNQPYEKIKHEADPLKPTTHYSFSKFLGEECCRFYARAFKVNTLVIRTANVYGPKQDGIYIVPVITSHLLARKQLTLTKRAVERCFIYIDDLVDGYIKLAQWPTLPGEVFNIGPDKPNKMAELVKQIEKISGQKAKITYTGEDRPHEADKNRVNTNKIKTTLNWKPQISLETGLKRYLDSLNQ